MFELCLLGYIVVLGQTYYYIYEMGIDVPTPFRQINSTLVLLVILKEGVVERKKSSVLKYIYNTYGDKNLHTLLVKHYNYLLDGQISEWSIDKVTYFYVGDLFCIHLGTKYANFQEKISAEISGKNA